MTEGPLLNLRDIVLLLRYVGLRVVENPLVPEGQVYVFNDLNRQVWRPDGWDSMTPEEQLRWAVDNGMTVVIRAIP